MIPNLSALATNDEPAEPRAVAPTGRVLSFVEHKGPDRTVTAEATLMISPSVHGQHFAWSKMPLSYQVEVRMSSCADEFPETFFTENQLFGFYQTLFNTVFQMYGEEKTYSLWTTGLYGPSGTGYLLAKFTKPPTYGQPTYESFVQMYYANNIGSNVDNQLQWRPPSGAATEYLPVSSGDKDEKGNDMLIKIFGYIAQAYKLGRNHANARGPFVFVVPGDTGNYNREAYFYSQLDIQSRNPNNFT